MSVRLLCRVFHIDNKEVDAILLSLATFNNQVPCVIAVLCVGSILAVTMTDQYASGKSNRFVGICLQRGGKGLGATFILRNSIANQGEGDID